MADSSKLPYNLDKLNWDPSHHFNGQNRYGYTGKGRKLGDAMLQCETCMQWFHGKEVSCLTEQDVFVAFQRNYRFSCRICSGGSEQFSLLTNTWSWIVVTALHNLQLPLDMKNNDVMEVTTRLPGERRWVPVDEITEWIRDHWGSLCHGRSIAQLEEGNAVRKCLAHSDGTCTLNHDKTEATLRNLHPTKLFMKPVKNVTVAASAVRPPPAAAPRSYMPNPNIFVFQPASPRVHIHKKHTRPAHLLFNSAASLLSDHRPSY